MPTGSAKWIENCRPVMVIQLLPKHFACRHRIAYSRILPTDAIRDLLQLYGDLGAAELTQHPRSQSAELAALLRATATLWAPTLRDLRANKKKGPLSSSLYLEFFENDNDPLLKEAINIWIEYGRKLGFEEGQDDPPHVRQALQQRGDGDCRKRPGWWRSSGCSWSGCFCCDSDIKPDHPMRVCTSCRLAMYCSKDCQRQ